MRRKNALQTEFDFTLPKGLIDAQGHVHRQGVMRLSTAKDEMLVQKDRLVRDHAAYSVLVMLSRVIVRLGSLTAVTPQFLEGLFALDIAYLREFYNRINQQGEAHIPTECPQCSAHFSVELALSGES
jgi:Zn finger protein HypA/HybF involved in hydrogenase expression